MKSKNRLRFDLTTEAGRSALQSIFPELFKTIPATTTELLVVDALATHRNLIATDPPYADAVEARSAETIRRQADLEAKGKADLEAKANRQEAAAKARAAKAAKAAGGNGQVEDLTGSEPNGQDQEDDLGLVDPNMSPAEALEAGLAIVREAYAAGKVAQVKALQKAWGIAKFYDIPNERGHEFFSQVMKLAHETGLRK